MGAVACFGGSEETVGCGEFFRGWGEFKGGGDGVAEFGVAAGGGVKGDGLAEVAAFVEMVVEPPGYAELGGELFEDGEGRGDVGAVVFVEADDVGEGVEDDEMGLVLVNGPLEFGKVVGVAACRKAAVAVRKYTSALDCAPRARRR